MQNLILDTLKNDFNLEIEKPLEQEKLKELNLIFHKYDKTFLDIAKLFVFCKDILEHNHKGKLNFYLGGFRYLKNIPELIEKTREEGMGYSINKSRLNQTVAKNRVEMLDLINRTNKWCKIFGAEEGGLEIDFD